MNTRFLKVIGCLECDFIESCASSIRFGMPELVVTPRHQALGLAFERVCQCLQLRLRLAVSVARWAPLPSYASTLISHAYLLLQ